MADVPIDAIDARCADAAHGGTDALLDVLVEPMQLGRPRRIGLQEELLQPQRAERLRERLADAFVFAQNDFRAATADIDDQEAFLGMRPAALHAQMNQAGFFLAGDDFDIGTQRGGGAGNELVLVAGIPDGRGGDGAHGFHLQPLVLLRHGVQHAANHIHGFVADAPRAEHARPQASDLPFGRENARRFSVFDLGRFHPNRVAPYIHRGVARHPNAIIAATSLPADEFSVYP